MSKLLIEKEEGFRNGEKTSEREINADSSSYREEDQAEEMASANCVKPRKPKRVVALKGRPSLTLLKSPCEF